MRQTNQQRTEIVIIEISVVPRVKMTELSVSPEYVSAKVEASPAVGIENATKKPRIIFVSTMLLGIARRAKRTATAAIGRTKSFKKEV